MKRLLVAGVVLVGCKASPARPDAGRADAASVVADAAVPKDAATAPSAEAPARPPTPTAPPIDAGSTACVLVTPPARQMWTGAASLFVASGGVHVAFSTDGGAVIAPVPRGRTTEQAMVGVGRRASRTPCTFAGTHAFCIDPIGAIHRTDVEAARDETVARAQPGTRISAAAVGGHEVVAFTRARRTTEGETLEAWTWSDDGKTERLSEDGSGATFVTLAPRGSGALALMLDARSAMTPVHARSLSWSGGLRVGADAVLFVGGGAEPNTRAALAVTRSGGAFALVPIARELGFSLGVARIEAEPKTDAPVRWFDYDNGLDPAPLAATVNSTVALALRVAPVGRGVGAPRVLEVLRLDPSAPPRRLGVVPTHGDPEEVALVEDGADVVIAYTDAIGTWIERRRCTD